MLAYILAYFIKKEKHVNVVQKKIVGLCAAFLCALGFTDATYAVTKFGSKSAQLRVAGNSQFNVSSPAAKVQSGGIAVDPTAGVKGNPLGFTGSLDQGSGGSVLSLIGQYNPSIGPNGTIYLQGNNSLYATTPGLVRSNVIVSGKNNLIQGTPTFADTLTLADALSQVTLAIDTPLNITINAPSGGRIDLGKNLSLADGVSLPAVDIAFNGFRLSLPGKTTPYTNTTRFLKGADLVLNGKTELQGATWVFCEDAVLNANGNVLDLSQGGTLQVCPTTTVQITDIAVRNISTNSLIFEDVDSAFELSNVTLEISKTVTTTIGAISVIGPTMVIIKDGTWTLTGDAAFTVDGVTAIVDSVINGSTGTLIVKADFTNNGAIRYLYTDPIIYLFGGILTSTFLTVTSSFFVPQNSTITFGATTTLDAGGGSIIFTNPDHPQLILLPGSNVTFQNVNIQNINFNTISMGIGSSLTFGFSTELELSSDITFTTGLIRFDAPGKTVLIRGETLSAINLDPAASHSGPLMDLGATTVVLENVEIRGPQYISYSTEIIDGKPVSGTLDLAGNSIIDIDSDIDLNIFVEKFNNYLQFLKDNVQLSGSLGFSDTGENILHMAFFGFVPTTGVPRVRFVDNYLYLASTDGRAQLIFDDFIAQVTNEGGNSFVIDTGAVLEGQNLIVNTFPIKLLSNDVVISSALQLTSDQQNAIDNSFVRSFFPSLFESHESKIDSMNEQNLIAGACEGDVIELHHDEELKNALDTFIFDEDVIRAPRVLQQNPKNKKRIERATNIPAVVTTYVNTVQLSQANGNLLLNQATVTEFGVSSAASLNLTMKDGATLIQGGNAVEFKNGDVLNIVGLGNVIRVVNQFTMNGSLLFDQGAELTIIFEERTAGDLSFVLNSNVLLEAGSILRAQGEGIVQLNDGVTITLKAGTATQGDAQCIFNESALLKVDTNATAIIDGVGFLTCRNNGGIALDRNCKLFIGQNTNDNIEFSVISGVIRLEIQDPADNDFARLSFAVANYELQILLSGLMYIGNHGVCEFNLRNDLYLGGTINLLSINLGGVVFVDTNGALNFAENTRLNIPLHPFPPFTFLSESGFFRGSGLVSFVKSNNSVEVTAQLGDIPSSLYMHQENVLARTLVYQLIQQSSNLKVSTLYLLANGTQIVLTKNGVRITLNNGDEVLNDDPKTGTIYVFNRFTRDNIAYGADGRRL
jgi:hypothetical protein